MSHPRLIALSALLVALICPPELHAQGEAAVKFGQLDERLPTPDEVRLASGAPGPKYWQQRVDYDIKATLDEDKRRITGRATITYYNRSPHPLDYLWLQLDQNRFKAGSGNRQTAVSQGFKEFPYRSLERLLRLEKLDAGFEIKSLRSRRKALPYVINDTMMRVDLPRPLRPGDDLELEVEWAFNIIDAEVIGGRGGYEHFTTEADGEGGNTLFTIAQWYPRLCAYTDVTGWQNKQFLGRGEFTLEMGNYEVELTVPADHVVAATGVLQNPRSVLSSEARSRLSKARKSFDKPVFIVTEEEAEAARKSKPGKGKTATWRFEADQVRDFAFASSRFFIHDAMAVKQGDRTVLAMSYYPKEAAPLWARYSTQAVAHTIEVYSRMTFDYPWPVAISVNGPVGGMEYPMISFNGPRAEEDGTYYDKWAKGRRWDRSKYGLISVIIHEVGHNWFPMIVNSDERQWTWMDEGLNTFLQFIAEQEWEPDYPSWRGEPEDIVDYMKGDYVVPIMTNSESLLQFGNNAYGKPATALNILRETIMGRELFDYAFKAYARRWRFRRPMPADFFRTMEDASGVDLDWFWRGWFYTTERVDLALDKVEEFQMVDGDPEEEEAFKRKEKAERAQTMTQQRNARVEYRVNRFPDLKDFYNEQDPLKTTDADRKSFKEMLDGLKPEERELLKTERRFYVLDVANKGGLVMPIILKLTFEDDTTEMRRHPAEIWARSANKISLLIMTKKALKQIELDPFRETADIDEWNNQLPRKVRQSRFKLFKRKYEPNAMQKAKKAEEEAKKKAEEEAKKAKEDDKADKAKADQS